ncbi:hypothetical protein BJ138DRAFT_1081517, partial [Hygrophoropsis aurantiaca]
MLCLLSLIHECTLRRTFSATRYSTSLSKHSSGSGKPFRLSKLQDLLTGRFVGQLLHRYWQYIKSMCQILSEEMFSADILLLVLLAVHSKSARCPILKI